MVATALMWNQPVMADDLIQSQIKEQHEQLEWSVYDELFKCYQAQPQHRRGLTQSQ